MRQSHTPLPWKCDYSPMGTHKADRTTFRVMVGKVGQIDKVVCDGLDPHDARFIVRAVNSHYDLLEALKAVVGSCVCAACIGDEGRDYPHKGDNALKAAKAAIAKAEEETA